MPSLGEFYFPNQPTPHSHNAHLQRSVVSQFLLRTFWPTLLSCDTAKERKEGVSGRVVTLQWLALAAAMVTAVAGVVAPIGLGQKIVDGHTINATFAYASDPTVFGQGTPSHVDYTISRACGNGSLPCPGVSPSDLVVSTDPTTTIGDIYDIFVAENITSCFESGTNGDGDLRSNPFQIQFRQYYREPATNDRQSKVNTTGLFTMLESVFLDGNFIVREGIVVDAINGGIGFRNHTVPIDPAIKHGAFWTEQLLWIEPDTICVDTNWTVEFGEQFTPFASTPQEDATDLVLIYRGPSPGIRTYATVPRPMSIEHKVDPNLFSRAFVTAHNFGVHLQNLLLMNPARNNTSGSTFSLDFNMDFWLLQTFIESNAVSSGGQLGALMDNGGGGYSTPSGVNSSDSEIITLDPTQFNLTAFNITQFYDYLSTNFPTNPIFGGSNPPNDTQTFSTIGEFSFAFTIAAVLIIHSETITVNSCQGFTAGSASSIDEPFVKCGYLIPPAAIKETGNSSHSPGRRLFQDIHVCASSLRAVIKDTAFRYIKTGSQPSLAGLQIEHANPVTYASNVDMPTWGVENPGSFWNMSDIALIWGVVDAKRFTNSNAIGTVRSDQLYLPAFTSDAYSGTGFGDSMVSISLSFTVVRRKSG